MQYAILHGADRVLTQSVISDLDVVVGLEPDDVIRRISQCLGDSGLWPIMEWPYDVGHTLTVFLATDDGREAMQLDMLNDRRGVGKYAVKSDVLLKRSVRRDGLPVVRPADETVYLVRKRIVKGDRAALVALSDQISGFARSEVAESMSSTLSVVGRRSVDSFLRGRPGVLGIRPIRSALNVLRQARRLFRPTGYWLHCASPEMAEAVVERFGAYLPHAVVLGSPDSPGAIVRLLMRRLRPGVVVTCEGAPILIRPDVTVDDESIDLAAPRIIEAFRARTEYRLGVS